MQHLFQIASCEARAKNDPAKLVIINSELHQTLYAAAHNRYLLQSITTVVDALGLLRHSTFVLPGSIELAEDLTGKGHISRGVGNEDRISLFIPLAER